ncbi:Peptidase C14, caspase catalytic [Penicillium italicum]|uniref:Peptidase C14, caspase catalytic n=1 Tax=Penicillium italicum TaxID=40296 RepID=A0A0A2L8X2_PENIT|nr:Peptidase C14, caspase catalytic [Penicillium italicum]
MAAIPASPITSSHRRSNPTHTVTAIPPSHLTSPTADRLLSKVTMLRRLGTISARPLGNKFKEDQLMVKAAVRLPLPATPSLSVMALPKATTSNTPAVRKGQLRGCINDVKNMSTYLNQNFGYAREDMVLLTDDQQNPMSQPTKANVLRAMHWLVKDARPNDSLFFHYSGHGGQTPDLDGDEEDGYDEVIYPVDFRVAGHIVDDEMHRIMVQTLQPGVRLTAIFDSCHSGSALDLPYIYSTSGVLKEPNLAKEAGQGLLGVVSAYARGDMGSMVSTAMGFIKKATKGDEVYERNKQTKTSPADVVMWSGSKDDQTSQDAQIGGQATGAMSWAFIAALRKNPQQSYVQLLNSIRDELSTKYSQKPQLSCSHPLDTDILYVM